MLLFLAPSAVPLVLFTFLPMVRAFWTSLHQWNLLSAMKWVGLDNYAHLLRDADTHRAFLNTFTYILGYLPLVYVGGLALALALNAAIPLRNLLRGVYFLPVVTSWIVVALIGVTTGVFGGVLRDVLCNEIPLVFHDHRPYALCAFCGCWAFIALEAVGSAAWLSLPVGAGVAAGLRLLALALNWRIPQWPRADAG